MPTIAQHLTFQWNRLQRLIPRPLRRLRAGISLWAFKPPYRLNVGCGGVRFDGWINLDLDYSPGVTDVIWDVTDSLPLPAGSCELIYNEHFLEHLSIEQGKKFLKECHRLLQPGGVLRVAMPALDETVRQYYENDWQNQPWLEKYGYAWIKTRAEYLNIAMRSWGHQWLYDREELQRRMTEAGFRTIRDCEWSVSAVELLRNRETRSESTLVCEGVKE